MFQHVLQKCDKRPVFESVLLHKRKHIKYLPTNWKYLVLYFIYKTVYNI